MTTAGVPDTFGCYRMIREIGRGGQGAVYLAHDTRLPRDVALKLLPPAAFVAEARLKRFRREAEVVAGLSHPGICDVLEADFSGESPYIAMRFVPGATLAREIRVLVGTPSVSSISPDTIAARSLLAMTSIGTAVTPSSVST